MYSRRGLVWKVGKLSAWIALAKKGYFEKRAELRN
jgi:hypothetical protein